MGEEARPRTLYVGNLDPNITEELLVTLFSNIGDCKGCKLIHEAGNDLYAFVEFADHSSAQMALMAMNKRQVLGREMKVNWATSPGTQTKVDTSNHAHVFVGDLSADIETHQLREAFQPFGQISDCKVIRDSQTLQSKGYGFVSFFNKDDAENAIAAMNGQWLGTKPIKTNWATRKPNAPYQHPSTPQRSSQKAMNYDEVFNQASDTNTTVYCGGIATGLTDKLIYDNFTQYGEIVNMRVFKDKGYAFIKFAKKEMAVKAIITAHGMDINGYAVKCSWGKETATDHGNPQSNSDNPMYPPPPPNSMPPMMYGGAQYPYYNPMGYWGYPPGYPPNMMPGYPQSYGPPNSQFQQQQQQHQGADQYRS